MSQPGDPPIVVSGGSISISIPKDLFPGLLGGDFTNPLKDIKRVEITGTGLPNYSATAVNNDIIIRIEYGNP